MLSAPVFEECETVQAPPVAPARPEPGNGESGIETEAFDFITRDVLERGADFFDG